MKNDYKSDERLRIENIEKVLGTLISWMSGSSVSPIRQDEAAELLRRLHEEGRP
jgi:hypothetical protein